MKTKAIRIATDFSNIPGGRFRDDGEYSGEQFREDVLIPALQQHDHVTVILDGTAGYPSSFLEEAFGGLVRSGFNPDDLRRKLEIRNEDPRYESYRLLAERYLLQSMSRMP